jgi:hypothetical protein
VVQKPTREIVLKAVRGREWDEEAFRCIIDRFQPNQQLRRNITLSKRAYHLSQDISANFCSATCATGKFGEPDRLSDTHWKTFLSLYR